MTVVVVRGNCLASDTLREKLRRQLNIRICKESVKIYFLLLLTDLSDMVTRAIKEGKCLNKVIHQVTVIERLLLCNKCSGKKKRFLN